MNTTQIRACGLVTTAGGLAWGATLVLSESMSRAELAGGLAWQLGAFAMLATMHATRATGTSRWGRGVLAATAAVLALATVWSVAFVVAPTAGGPILTALDLTWPLSQLLLLVTGVTVAVARGWPGRARWLPLLGGLWFPVSMAAVTAGGFLATAVPAAWIAISYTVIGLAIAGPVAAAFGTAREPVGAATR